MPNSRLALHGLRPSLIHGLCAFVASNSRSMRLFPAALDTPLDSPFSSTLSVHGLHFTVYAPSSSDSIAKLFRACFYGVSHNYRAICCKIGYRTDVPV